MNRTKLPIAPWHRGPLWPCGPVCINRVDLSGFPAEQMLPQASSARGLRKFFGFASSCGTTKLEVDAMEHQNDSLDFDEIPAFMPKEKPVHEVRLGAIKAAIWKNDTEKGVRYNTTFNRLYRDGEEWKNTDSFGRDDLLVLGKVADQAHSWIHAQSQDNREENGKQSPAK